MIDLSRYLVGEIATVSALVKTFLPDRQVDDAIEAAVEFAAGAVGTIESTRLALGRRNAFQCEINGTKGSLAFDMERLNESRFSADGDRARDLRPCSSQQTIRSGTLRAHGHLAGARRS